MTSQPARITFAAPSRELGDLDGAVEAAALRVLRSGAYVLGDDVARFEAAFARASGVAHVVGVSSGSDALVASLLAVGVRPGDVVIAPAYSFVATAEAIVRVGAIPRYCDVTADEALLDVEPIAASSAISNGARAIVVVALYGRVPQVASLRALNMPIVVDAAQAVGIEGALSSGDVACASFYPSKTLGAVGDAGACATNDPELAARLREIRQHGVVDRHRYARVGGNFRLDAIQAAILEVKLTRLRDRMARRASIARAITDALGLPSDRRLTAPFVALRVRDRDGARARFADAGIDSEIHYPYTLPSLRHLGGEVAMPLPNASRWAEEALCIPAHAELLDDEVARLIEVAATIAPSVVRPQSLGGASSFG